MRSALGCERRVGRLAPPAAQNLPASSQAPGTEPNSTISGPARKYTDQALAAAEDIAEDGDRDLVLADLETIPGQPRYW